MVRQKAFAGKLLTCSLAIMIICLLYNDYMVVDAASGISWAGTTIFNDSFYIEANEGNKTGDSSYCDSGKIYGTRYFSIYPDQGKFFDSGYLVHLQYNYTLHGFDEWKTAYNNANVSFILSNPIFDFSVYIDGYEYDLTWKNDIWFTVPSVQNPVSELYIKVNYSYDWLATYNNVTLGSTVNVGVSSDIYFNIPIWEEYNESDYYSSLMNAVKNISNDVSGVQGAVNNQTDVIIQESYKEQSLISQGNELQQDSNDLQEQANTLQEESNTTQKNIFEKITDFFDNFFSRLGDFLLGLIVPSADDLTAFLDEVNAWFSDRLGFIWYPFGFAVDAVSALAGGDANTQFMVPALQINMLGGTYTIWNEMSVDIDAFDIFKYVRLFTSFICVGGIVALAYNKWDEWIGGHGVG